MKAPIEIEVALTQFEEAAKRFQHLETRLIASPLNEFRTTFHPLAPGDLAHRIGKTEIARIEYMIGSGQSQKTLFYRRTSVAITTAPSSST